MKDLKLIQGKSQFNSEEWHDIKPTDFDAEFKKYCSLIDKKCLVQDLLTQHLLISEMLEEKLIFLADRRECCSKWESAIRLYSEFISDLEIFIRELPSQSPQNEMIQCLNSMILVETTLIKKILSAMRMNLSTISVKEDLNPPRFGMLITFLSIIFVLSMVVNFSSELGIDIVKLRQLPFFFFLLAAVMSGKLFCAHNTTNSTAKFSEFKNLNIYSNQKFNLLFIQKSALKNKIRLYQNQYNNGTLLVKESLLV